MDEFFFGGSLEAFGDVGKDGNGGTADLVFETVVFPVSGNVVDEVDQNSRLLEDEEVFEGLGGWHTEILADFSDTVARWHAGLMQWHGATVSLVALREINKAQGSCAVSPCVSQSVVFLE